MDHGYIGVNSDYCFSNFAKEITIYISDFVVYKLTNILKCDVCKDALCATDINCFLNSLISMKNKGGNNGGLVYPSEDVIDVCFITEKILKSFDYTNKAVNKLNIHNPKLLIIIYTVQIYSNH